MEGPFYQDTLPPFMIASPTAVTLTSADKALYPAGSHPSFANAFLNKVAGKEYYLRLFGRMTTAATPGNGTFSLYWGSGADANGTVLCASAAQTLIASQTNSPFLCEIWARVQTLGATGTIIAYGRVQFEVGLVAARTFLLPSATPAAVTVDLTGSSIFSLQLKRSGSTAETAQTLDLSVQPNN